MTRHIAFLGFLAIATAFMSSNKKSTRQNEQCNRIFADSLLNDTIIRVAAKPAAGFNFSYYIFIPKNTRINSEQFLLVETNNTGVNDTIQFHDKNARLQAERNSLGSSIARRLKVPFLVPVFPRSQKEWKIYTHSLDRDAVLIKSGDNKRLDLQLIAMINDAGSAISPFHIFLRKKVLLNGFSASGTFANRFTLIHPEIVAAVACGGINAIPILPVRSIEKTKLEYPVGINDFKSIFGAEPDFENYKKIPQFIYMGTQDNNDAVLFDDAYSDGEREKIFKVLGKNMLPERWEKCKSVYETNGINSVFKLYPDIGHGTNRKIHSEIVEFFKKMN